VAEIVYGVTDNGFVRKPVDVILDSLNKRFTGQFGDSFDTSPESPDGQVIGIVADEIDTCWNQAEQAYNAYRPGATEAIALDNICELTGAIRYVNKPTTVTVMLSGDVGAVQTSGLVVGDSQGNQFTLANNVTLPGDATFTCTKYGEIYVAPNTVTSIVSGGVDGLKSVNNPEAGYTGVDYESDVSLRSRRDKTTVSSGSSSVESIYATLSALGLEYIRIRDNDTDKQIGNQPPNSLYVVVDGGTVNDIAQRISERKAGGVPTYGTTSVTVYDVKGNPQTINFSRSTRIGVFIDVEFRRLPTANISSNDAATNIKAAVVSYINSLQPGAPVAWSYIVPSVLSSNTGIQIDSLKVGLSVDSMGTDTISFDIDERALTAVENITTKDNTVSG
jgi:uncharacterized phage protein gp47/JayE